MKITDVRCRLLSYEMPESQWYTDDFGTCIQVNAALIEVETDSGIVGVGEANYSDVVCKTIIDNQLKPLLIGQDPFNIELLWEKMYTSTRVRFTIENGNTVPIYPRSGETIYAISGVDIALWDIVGKALKMPVYKVLGAGGYRESLKCYASFGPSTLRPDELADEARRYVDEGFIAFKLRWGLSEEDVERVAAARAAVGPRFGLMLDAHGTQDPATAIRMAKRFEPFDIAWYEDPVAWGDFDGLAEVRAKTYIPIATGESECTRYPFKELLMKKAVDIVLADPTMVGGLTEARRIAVLAHAFNKRFVAHTWGAGVSLAASLHLSCAVPNTFIFEFPTAGIPLIDDIFVEPIIPKNGVISVPQRPGLGFELDEQKLERYSFKKTDAAISPQVRKI